MKKKKFVTALSLMLSALLFLSACGRLPLPVGGTDSALQDGSFAESDGDTGSSEDGITDSSADSSAGEADASAEEATPEAVEDPTVSRGTSLSINPDGELIIDRVGGTPVAGPADGKWTVFVYMCGADLESEYKAATRDLNEMVASTGQTSDLRYIVLAGGANTWHTDLCDPQKNTVLLIENGTMRSVASNQGSMGDPEVLTIFLQWALDKYDSEHIVLDFWDHGGGSLYGVCFDERYDSDALSLLEIDAALAAAYETTRRKFDLIGYDACLMATAEVANILVPYGSYMIASEETEPGSGWDYAAFGLSVANGTDNGAQLGADIVSTYFRSLSETSQAKCTLSVIDLSTMDTFLKAFNSFSIDIYDFICNKDGLDAVISASNAVTSFGAGNYNMLDLGELISANMQYSDNARRVVALLDDAVVYMENGELYENASGLSVYFPVIPRGSQHIPVLKNICVTPYYMGVIDVCVYGKNAMGSIEGYDPDEWIDEGSTFWSDTDVDESDYDYWEDESDTYEVNNDYNKTAVKFAVMPHIGIEKVTFFFNILSYEYKVITFTIADGYLDKLKATYGNYYMEFQDSNTGKNLYLGLGKKRGSGEFLGSSVSDSLSSLSLDGVKYPFREEGYPYIHTDNIRDETSVLPNGQILAQYPYQYAEEETPDSGDSEKPQELFYSYSPVLYNGKMANLLYGRFRFYKDEGSSKGKWKAPAYVVLVTENGMSSRLYPLEAGDVIAPLYPAYDPATMEFVEYYKGSEYTCTGDTDDYIVQTHGLVGGGYKYSMTIEDIYGHTVDTPLVSLYFYTDDEQAGNASDHDILEDSF